ncbi:MAG: ABC transporter transmembrane domain-containing protein [Chloroflexota bacterium]|nr:ABC transporter transmembrane domain-containing protein [Chloroflexota bacterium]
MTNREFSPVQEYLFNRDNAMRWILAHLLRYKRFVAVFLLATLTLNVVLSLVPRLTGLAFDEVLRPQPSRDRLLTIALSILGIVLVSGIIDLSGRLSSELLGKRLARDARDELYVSLLGKSQTFHNRQRTADIMARATGDVQQLSNMIVPGADLIIDSMMSLLVPIVFMGLIDPRLLLAPLLFTLMFAVALHDYTRRLNPVTGAMRAQYGTMNAGLAETVTGIEVVKAAA